MRIRDYVRPELVTCGLSGSGIEDTLQALVALAADALPLTDPGALLRALVAREEAHTTALESGVAVPHTTVPGITEPVVVIGMAPTGIGFGPPDYPPVQLFFLLLSPPDQARLHIKLLARIARMARREGFVQGLCGSGDVTALLAELDRAEPARD